MTKPVTRKMAVDCLLHRFWSYGYYVSAANYAGAAPCEIDCTICGKPIVPGQDIQFDHIHADVHGGPHEYKNLRPVHAQCHKIKTKTDIQANAKVKRILADKPSRRPMKSSGRKMPSRPFQKRPVKD